MISLDIVIVNWNSGAQLRNCLQSIPPACAAPLLHLNGCVVVDNASVDRSAAGLDDLPLMLTIIRNPENRGFACACNQGAVVGKGEYILFLNPDIRMFVDSLRDPLLFLEEEQNRSIGILGIQLIDNKGIVHRNVSRFPTPRSLFFQMLGFDHLWPRYFPPHFLTDWNHMESREVDQVQGAFFLVRRQLFEELKGFDERFFMYFEDLDFAYRARRAAWKSYYFAAAQALHVGGGSSSQVKAKRLAYILDSRIRYVAKHFGRLSALGIFVTSLCIEFWTRLAGSLIGFSGQNAEETLQAYGMFIKNFPGVLGELDTK